MRAILQRGTISLSVRRLLPLWGSLPLRGLAGTFQPHPDRWRHGEPGPPPEKWQL